MIYYAILCFPLKHFNELKLLELEASSLEEVESRLTASVPEAIIIRVFSSNEVTDSEHALKTFWSTPNLATDDRPFCTVCLLLTIVCISLMLLLCGGFQ